MDKFRDYIWYLLSSPFKIIKKARNQWWIWVSVLGGWFDEVKEDIQRARDETTIATCSDIMLRYHGEDRGPDGITQYVGETNDAFRSRIAMYDEVEQMGGTRDGIILAVNSVGYANVEHVWLPLYNGDASRWAEFIVIITEDIANAQPTTTENLIREVRDKKESITKDNYLIVYNADVWTRLLSEAGLVYHMRCLFFESRRLDGTGKLNGTHSLSGAVGRIDALPDYLIRVFTYSIIRATQEMEYALTVAHDGMHPEIRHGTELATAFFPGRHLDGSRKLDGTHNLSGAVGRIDALPDYLVRVFTYSIIRAAQETEYALTVVHDGAQSEIGHGTELATAFFPGRHLDGSRKLDGTHSLSGAVGQIDTTQNYLMSSQSAIESDVSGDWTMESEAEANSEPTAEINGSAHFWYGRRLDGSRKLDGTRTLSTVPGRAVPRNENAFDVYTVYQASGSIG